MAESRFSRESVRWLLLEGTAIVVSILLAFWIDAYWAERQTQRDLHEHLRMIRQDLQTSRENIARRWKFTKAREESIAALLESSFGAGPGKGDQALDADLANLLWHMSDSPVDTGGLDSLVSSNLIDSIENPELRNALTAWPAHLDWLEIALAQDYDIYVSVLMPHIRAHGYLPQIARQWTQVPGLPDEPTQAFPLEPNRTFDHREMLSGTEFQNILVQSWAVQHEILAAFAATDRFVAETLEYLEAELNESSTSDE